MISKSHFQVTSEIQAAAASGRGVVALESTVIAHGLPRPQNLETAKRLEHIVREGGGVPATIAILKGTIHVGLTADQLQHVAQSDDVHKVSRRDLPLAVANQWDGATTVAATLWVAANASIGVFATGGIGGVHRGDLPDVSADLPELARSPMIVVCSGAKSILDLPATREWLETYGVTVIGYQCDEMPAFFSRGSGLPVDVRANSAEDVAKIARARRELDMQGSVLVTVPVPADAEVPADTVQSALDKALKEAKRKSVAGRELTPYLLTRMAELTDGATLRANIALLENNARVAVQVAQSLVKKRETIGFRR